MPSQSNQQFGWQGLLGRWLSLQISNDYLCRTALAAPSRSRAVGTATTYPCVSLHGGQDPDLGILRWISTDFPHGLNSGCVHCVRAPVNWLAVLSACNDLTVARLNEGFRWISLALLLHRLKWRCRTGSIQSLLQREQGSRQAG